MDKLQNRVIEIIAETLEIDKKSIDKNSRQHDFSEWDSLAQLMIINKVEEEFNIQIEDNAIKSLNTVQKLLNYVLEKINP